MKRNNIPQDLLKEVVSYEKNTGIFRWKRDVSVSVKANTIAGYTRKNTGYTIIRIKGVGYSAHRLAWIYVNGDIPDGYDIDHKNHNTSDNRIDNLRLVTIYQQNQHRRKPSDNKSGYKGVCWNERLSKWKVYCGYNGTQYHIGYFDKLEDARDAYLYAQEKYHKEYSCI